MMQENLQETSKIEKINPVKIAQYATGKHLLGAPLQKFRLIIKAAGQKRHTELVGDVYDVTDKFMSPYLVARFKRLICDEICAIRHIVDSSPIYEEDLIVNNADLSKNEGVEAEKASEKLAELHPSTDESIKQVVGAFKAFKLSGICRVLLLDEDYSDEMHIIIQFGRLNALTDYATIPNMIGRSYLKSQNIVYFAMGWGLSLPMRRKLPDNLGKGHVHWIIPTDLNRDSEAAVSVLKQATVFAEIIPHMHQEVVFDDYKKATDGQIHSLKTALNESTPIIKVQATQLEVFNFLKSRLLRHGPMADISGGSGDFKTFVCYALPTIAFGFLGLAGWGGFGAVVGMFLGLVSGGFFASKVR